MPQINMPSDFQRDLNAWVSRKLAALAGAARPSRDDLAALIRRRHAATLSDLPAGSAIAGERRAAMTPAGAFALGWSPGHPVPDCVLLYASSAAAPYGWSAGGAVLPAAWTCASSPLAALTATGLTKGVAAAGQGTRAWVSATGRLVSWGPSWGYGSACESIADGVWLDGVREWGAPAGYGSRVLAAGLCTLADARQALVWAEEDGIYLRPLGAPEYPDDGACDADDWTQDDQDWWDYLAEESAWCAGGGAGEDPEYCADIAAEIAALTPRWEAHQACLALQAAQAEWAAEWGDTYRPWAAAPPAAADWHWAEIGPDGLRLALTYDAGEDGAAVVEAEWDGARGDWDAEGLIYVGPAAALAEVDASGPVAGAVWVREESSEGIVPDIDHHYTSAYRVVVSAGYGPDGLRVLSAIASEDYALRVTEVGAAPPGAPPGSGVGGVWDPCDTNWYGPLLLVPVASDGGATYYVAWSVSHPWGQADEERLERRLSVRLGAPGDAEAAEVWSGAVHGWERTAQVSGGYGGLPGFVVIEHTSGGEAGCWDLMGASSWGAAVCDRTSPLLSAAEAAVCAALGEPLEPVPCSEGPWAALATAAPVVLAGGCDAGAGIATVVIRGSADCVLSIEADCSYSQADTVTPAVVVHVAGGPAAWEAGEECGEVDAGGVVVTRVAPAEDAELLAAAVRAAALAAVARPGGSEADAVVWRGGPAGLPSVSSVRIDPADGTPGELSRDSAGVLSSGTFPSGWSLAGAARKGVAPGFA